MAKIVYSSRARNDMLAVWLWIADKNGVVSADNIVDRIECRIAMLEHYPEMGPARREIAEGARVLVIERWLALYDVNGDHVRIVRIVDGASDLKQIAWDR